MKTAKICTDFIGKESSILFAEQIIVDKKDSFAIDFQKHKKGKKDICKM